MTLAKHRWIIEGNKLTLADGTEWKLPRKIPDAVKQELARLPYDYLELGNRCADLQDDARMARREADAVVGEAEGWKMKYENIVNLDVNTQDKIIGILTEDMELACNLLIRIAVALGIQPGGEFYNKIKNLVEKYGMKMQYAKDYTWEGTVMPTAVPALDPGDVEGQGQLVFAEDGTASIHMKLPPGSEDDPFEYHLHIWEDDGGDGTHG